MSLFNDEQVTNFTIQIRIGSTWFAIIFLQQQKLTLNSYSIITFVWLFERRRRKRKWKPLKFLIKQTNKEEEEKRAHKPLKNRANYFIFREQNKPVLIIDLFM